MPKKNYSRSTRKVVRINRWRAQLRHRGLHVYLGSFPTWSEAKAVEDAYREKHNLAPYNPQRNTRAS